VIWIVVVQPFAYASDRNRATAVDHAHDRGACARRLNSIDSSIVGGKKCSLTFGRTVAAAMQGAVDQAFADDYGRCLSPEERRRRGQRHEAIAPRTGERVRAEQ
jgi:hypothetical protein